jgi:lipoprotein NlpI
MNTPLTNAVATDGWSGDALAVPVEFAQQQELKIQELSEALSKATNKQFRRAPDELLFQVTDLLYRLGWRAPADAQWDHLHAALPELAEMLQPLLSREKSND